jgi:hypothetical protein
MARGGKREGAGRKKGALTKRTKEIAERALAEGKTPLEVMLDNMRHFQQVALDAEQVINDLTVAESSGKEVSPADQFKVLLAQVKQAAGLRHMAHECARDAAPFMHPRLSATTIAGDSDNPLEVINRIERVIVGAQQDATDRNTESVPTTH